MDEQALLAALRVQDESALAYAIKHFGGYVAAVVRNTLGTQATAEDVEELVSDVFVALWKNAPRFRESTSFKPWLAVVARNTSLKWCRTAHPLESLNDDVAATVAAARSTIDDEVLHSIMQHAQQEQLHEALCQLEPQDRQLFERHYLKDESIGSIARQTGMNRSTIKSRLFRNRRKLKEHLSQGGNLQ